MIDGSFEWGKPQFTRLDVAIGSFSEVDTGIGEVCFAPINGLRQSGLSGPKSADIVAKVENRTTLKISRKLICGPFCCCTAFQRYQGGPWSILGETIWSLTSL